MLDSKVISLLHLTRQENKILKALENGDYNISDLAVLTRFPRTTLYTALSSLKKRGLITRSTKGKSVLISLVPSPEISKLFAESATAFSPEGNVRVANKSKTGKTSGFTLIYGKKAMFKVWQSLADINSKERFYAIQPTRSLINTVKLFKPGEFVPINNAIKKNKVIVDAIMKEDGFPTYMDLHKGQPDVQKKIIKSFLGRSADMSVVKNEYLNNNAELLIAPSSAFIMNWENEVGIKIENRDMIDLLRELYLLAKGYGKKIDFNEYMREWEKKVLHP
jgi:DNA-binding transcriptional ArsR family regulator